VTAYVLDASALLAAAREEPGGDTVVQFMERSRMSAVNASEALMRGAEKGIPIEAMQDLLDSSGIELVPFDTELAAATARLRQPTRHLGLSFADRACLATAIRYGATALTADRAWGELDLPCPVELIR
jgi:ribonuclease VapC